MVRSFDKLMITMNGLPHRVPRFMRIFDLRFRLLIFGIVFCVAAIARYPADAEVISYKDVVRDTLSSSARLRVKKEDINIAYASYKQVFAGLYPEISLSSRLERYENLDKSAQQGIKSVGSEVVGSGDSAWRSQLYLSGQYDISSWYKKRYEAAYYEKLKDVSGYDCEAETKRLLKEVTDLFGSSAEGWVRLKYGADIIEKLKAWHDLKKQAFAGGEAAYEEVLKAEADVVSAERERAAVIRELKENIERLQIYTGKNYAPEMEVETLKVGTGKDITETLEIIQGTPEYKARLKELEALQFKEKSARNNYLPDISLYGRYDYYGSDINGPDSALRDVREAGYNAGLMIRLPLFDGGARKWERVKSLHEIRKQQESIKATMEEKRRDIRTIHAGYAELLRTLGHYRRLAEQYGKLCAISQKAQAYGQRSMADILELQKDYLTVERDVKVTENSLAIYEKRLILETDYTNFVREFYGNGACLH
jgi:outer membrane protein TolC